MEARCRLYFGGRIPVYKESQAMLTDQLDGISVLWVFGAIQLLGMVAAWLSRVSEGSILQAWSQRFFLLALLLAGATTMASPAFGRGYWLISSAILGLMVVLAVCDFRQEDRAFTI
jgi:hypothetical protein